MIPRRQIAMNYAILAVFAFLAIFPLLGVIASALTPSAQATASFTFPRHPTLGNFATAWREGHFSAYMRSSLTVTVSVVVLATILAVLAGYAFATMDFPGKTVLFYLLLSGLMIPEEAVIIPMYFDLRSVNLTDSYWSLILPQTAQSLAFGVFWMRTYFRSLPVEISEAARLDGASNRQILWRIFVPVSRPAVITMAMLVFMWTWNEFFLPLVMIVSDDKRTAPLGLTFFKGQYTSDFALLGAGATIVAAPVVILYLILQRQVIAGMLTGAVKG